MRLRHIAIIFALGLISILAAFAVPVATIGIIYIAVPAAIIYGALHARNRRRRDNDAVADARATRRADADKRLAAADETYQTILNHWLSTDDEMTSTNPANARFFRALEAARTTHADVHAPADEDADPNTWEATQRHVRNADNWAHIVDQLTDAWNATSFDKDAAHTR